MDFRHIDHALRKELRHQENRLLFKEASKRNLAFTHHHTPFSVLSVLDDRSKDTYQEKEILTRALIMEQQRSPRSLWTNMLVKAFLPMLFCLRNRIRGHLLPQDDLDQLICYSFLEVIRQFPLVKWPTYTFIRLQQQTAKLVFNELKQEQGYLSLYTEDDLDDLEVRCLKKRPHGRIWPPGIREPVDPNHLAAWLRESVENTLDHQDLDIIIATKIYGEDLRIYIKRNHLGSKYSTDEQNYQRYKRRRTRALGTLQKNLLQRVSPIDIPEAL